MSSVMDDDKSDQSRRRARQVVLRLLPVALLLAGIAFHGIKILAFDDDPQRGSAFAMFASVDIGATRRVLATTTDGTVVDLEIPSTLAEQSLRLADSPSDESARELAAKLVELTWKVTGRTAVVGAGVKFEHVRVQVVGLEAEGRTIVRQVLTDVVTGPDS